MEVRELKNATEVLMKAPKLGSTEAQDTLGIIYDDEIKPNDPEKAMHWHTQSANGENNIAASDLAMNYKDINNRRCYIHWLKRAAKMGNDDALKELKSTAR